MKRRQMCTGIFSMLGIFFLILDRPAALAGAGEGLQLSLKTVIPGLFPFFFLISLLNGSIGSCRILSPLARFMGIPENSESLLIPFFLGGYPIGAKTAAEFWKEEKIDRAAAQRLLLFCSNAGPAFLFGVLPAVLPEKWMVPSLWLIHMGTAIWIASMIPAVKSGTGMAHRKAVSPSDAMMSALKASALVCGWILCFRILSTALDKWLLWRLPQSLQVFLSGLLELTAGCLRLGELSSIELRYVFSAGFLGFGGLCVAMQTASVLNGLSLKPYLLGKLLHGVFSMIFSLSVITHTWPAALAIAVLITAFLQKGRK